MAVNDVSIIGGPFQKYVNDQIDVRQEVHGSGYGESNKTQQEITYLNGRNSWVKVASSVKIEDIKRLTDIGFTQTEANRYKGIGLAKEYVLFNGTSRVRDENSILGRSGIDQRKKLSNTGAYGAGGTNTFGIQAMPGITGFNVAHNNIGSIRTGKINIRANSLEQFNILELLYVRLGYTILVEWGHGIYFDNNKNFSQMGPTLVDDTKNGWFTQEGTTHLQFYEKIEKIKSDYQGNYDAFFCKVKNFSWKFTPQGYYDIELDLISLGDVIESVKVNNLSREIPVDPTKPDNAEININSIKNFLYCSRIESFSDTADSTSISQQQESKKDFVKASYTTVINNSGGAQASNNVINKGKDYVRLGAFLEWVQDNILPTQINGDAREACILIDTRLDNYMMNFPGLISTDPRICIIRNEFPQYKENQIGGIEKTKSLFDVFEEITPPTGTKESRSRGIIMNIYLTHDFIDSIMTVDQSVPFSLYDLINKICEGINSCLGGCVELKPALPTDDGKTLYILDHNLNIRVGKDGNRINDTDNSSTLQVYGFGEESSNFVRNFSFDTKISKDLAQMISIGATANNETTSDISDFFTNLNKGLQDRFSQTQIDGNLEATGSVKLKCFDGELITTNDNFKAFTEGQPIATTGTSGNTLDDSVFNPDENEDRVEKSKLSQKRTAYLDRLMSYFGPYIEGTKPINYLDVGDEDVSKNRTILSEFIRTYIIETSKALGKDGNISSSIIGFIPIEIEIEVDGLSGMKLYNQVLVDSKFLPRDYQNSEGDKKIEFIVRGLTHVLQNNTWSTTITALSKPAGTLLNITLEDSKLSKKIDKVDILDEDIPLIFERPAPGSVRVDSGGDGNFGASREGGEIHTGLDISTFIGEKIYAPISGILQSSKATPTNKLPGVKIIGSGDYEGYTVYMFYSKKLSSLNFGDFVQQGDVVSTAVDLSPQYPESVTDHIHFKVEKGSKEINPENLKYSNFLPGLSIPSPINPRLLN